jgi:hypothetical protein
VKCCRRFSVIIETLSVCNGSLGVLRSVETSCGIYQPNILGE